MIVTDVTSDGRLRAVERALIETGGVQAAVREKIAAAIIDVVDTHDREHPDEQRLRILREAAAFLRGEYEGPEQAIDAVSQPELYRPASEPSTEADDLRRVGVNINQEMRERMDLIERLAPVLDEHGGENCDDSGIDREGAGWTLCQCVLRRLADLEAGRAGRQRQSAAGPRVGRR